MIDKITNREINTPLNPGTYEILGKIIKKENSDSILSSFSLKLIKKYLEISIKSENLFLYVCEHNNNIIGYALLAKKPSFLISEFKSIKYSIFLNMILSFNLKVLMNLFISMSKIDLLLISKINKDFINKNLNLNLLAIDKKFQSKGIGRMFVLNMLSDIKKRYKFQNVTVETYSKRAASFYQSKLNFQYMGVKLRFFKNLPTYKKKL